MENLLAVKRRVENMSPDEAKEEYVKEFVRLREIHIDSDSRLYRASLERRMSALQVLISG